MHAAANGLSVTTPAGTVAVPTLAFPFPPGFDPSNPGPVLGITAADLEKLIAAPLAPALTDALGSAGAALVVLAGCGAGVPGLPSGLPTVVDAASGTLFTDPAASLRAWLAQIAAASAGGEDAARQSSPGSLGCWPTTCRGQGSATDPMAVIDQYCRVNSVQGLWVADASVMPHIRRSGGAYATVIMIYERIAGWVAAG